MDATIDLLSNSGTQAYTDCLKAVYKSKLCLPYHKNFEVIRKFLTLAQNRNGSVQN